MARCEVCPQEPGVRCIGECPGMDRICATLRGGNGSAAGIVRLATGRPCPGATPPAPSPALPGLVTRAANFAAAVVSHVAAGLPAAGAELAAARLAICRGCDRFVAPNGCAVCGCNLAAKAAWAEQECPLGRWPVSPAGPS